MRCHIVKNALLHIAFSAILPAGQVKPLRSGNLILSRRNGNFVTGKPDIQIKLFLSRHTAFRRLTEKEDDKMWCNFLNQLFYSPYTMLWPNGNQALERSSNNWWEQDKNLLRCFSKTERRWMRRWNDIKTLKRPRNNFLMSFAGCLCY